MTRVTNPSWNIGIFKHVGIFKHGGGSPLPGLGMMVAPAAGPSRSRCALPYPRFAR